MALATARNMHGCTANGRARKCSQCIVRGVVARFPMQPAAPPDGPVAFFGEGGHSERVESDKQGAGTGEIQSPVTAEHVPSSGHGQEAPTPARGSAPQAPPEVPILLAPILHGQVLEQHSSCPRPPSQSPSAPPPLESMPHRCSRWAILGSRPRRALDAGQARQTLARPWLCHTPPRPSHSYPRRAPSLCTYPIHHFLRLHRQTPSTSRPGARALIPPSCPRGAATPSSFSSRTAPPDALDLDAALGR